MPQLVLCVALFDTVASADAFYKKVRALCPNQGEELDGCEAIHLVGEEVPEATLARLRDHMQVFAFQLSAAGAKSEFTGEGGKAFEAYIADLLQSTAKGQSA